MLDSMGLSKIARLVALATVAGCGGGGQNTTSTPGGGAPAILGQADTVVAVGSGSAESSIRQIVRTLDGRVYIAAVDDNGSSSSGAVLRMFRSTSAGLPRGFDEVDPAHRPATGTGTLSGGDARLDRNGLIHVAFYATSSGAYLYNTFSPGSDEWGREETVTTSGGSPDDNDFGRRGRVVSAIAVDRHNVPFYAAAGRDALRMYRREPTGWVLEAELSHQAAEHPSLTFDRQNRLHVAWIDGDQTIAYALRSANGSWEGSPPVASGSEVQRNGNLDQSPSLAVDAADSPVVIYLSGTPAGSDSFVHVRALGASGQWVEESPSQVYAHTPGLYLRGSNIFALLGHDVNIHPAYLTRAAGSSAWSDVFVFQPTGSYDGSASARFDPQLDVDCSVVDVVFFDENSDLRGGFKPDLYYVAIRLAGDSSGAGGCREIIS
jgi:hypothetical protein